MLAIYHRFTMCLFWLLSSGIGLAEGQLPISDDFSKPELPFRSLGRGLWKVADGMTTCTQDDELYKKFKDHGPMITYRVPHKDANIKMAFRPDERVKNVVFTINGNSGHVFRIVSSTAGTRAFVFVGDDHKSSPIATDLPKFIVGDWNKYEVDVQGKKLKIKFGDYVKEFENDALDTAKVNVTIGFAFGTLSVKEVMISP
jgi:hypothetical protein